MGTSRSIPAASMCEIAAELLARPEVAVRAQVIVDWVCELVSDAAVVYVIEDQNNPAWKPIATAGPIEVSEVVEFNAGTLGVLAQSRELQVFEGASLQREDLSHLDIRRTAAALAYVPLMVEGSLVGAVELIGYDQPFPTAALEMLSEIADLASPGLVAAMNYENERNSACSQSAA